MTQLRQLYPLALVFLSTGVSTAMVSPFLTLFLTDAVHASPVEVTAYLVAAPLSAMVVSTSLGGLTDRRPIRRTLIITAALVGSAGAVATALIREYWILFGLTITATALAGVILPQLFAYARVTLAGSTRAAMTMSTLRTLFSLSWVAGPFLATVLLSLGGFTVVYAVSATMLALTALVVWRLFHDTPVVAEDAPVAVVRGVDASRRVLVTTLVALVLVQCAGNLSVQALSLLIKTDLHGDIGDAGLILGLCAGLEIPLMLGFGALSTRVRLRPLILAGPVCTLTYALAVSASTHTWQLAAAQILNASAIALVQGLGVTYVQDMLPHHPGRASTLFANAFPAGVMLAGPILGAAQHVGYRTAYLAGAVLAGSAFVLLLTARPPRVPVTPPVTQEALVAAEAR